MRRACMVVHAYYPDDSRVRREAETLLANGWTVDIICLRGHGETPSENCGGAEVHRLPVRRHRGSGLRMYLIEYLAFFVLASLRLMRLHWRQHYQVIQVHNMPDFLVFVALVPRLFGAQVILDIHDVVPELYAQKFGGSSRVVRITRWVERASTRFANHVITAGEPFRRLLVGRGLSRKKVTVIMNTADPRIFHRPADDRPQSDHFVLIYHGSLFERYGIDLAIKAVAQLKDEIPGLCLEIYGEGEAEGDLQALAVRLGLSDRVRFHGQVPLEELPAAIAAADLAVVPYRKNPFTDLLYPTKAFESIVMDIPVLLARTGAVAELFRDIPEMFFEPDDTDDLARQILELHRNPEIREHLARAARDVYAPLRWEQQQRVYLALMDQVCGVIKYDAAASRSTI